MCQKLWPSGRRAGSSKCPAPLSISPSDPPLAGGARHVVPLALLCAHRCPSVPHVVQGRALRCTTSSPSDWTLVYWGIHRWEVQCSKTCALHSSRPWCSGACEAMWRSVKRPHLPRASRNPTGAAATRKRRRAGGLWGGLGSSENEESQQSEPSRLGKSFSH